MLRITPSQNAQAAKQYFAKGMVRDDYYMDGQEIAGMWGGKAAERLGLTGVVAQEDYFAVVDNRDPRSGEQLTPRQKGNRRAGYDFTFSVPKSVSVVYELSQDERILFAFREAVRETMEEIEREMKTRVRKRGENTNRLTGSMAWAEFVHFTSRPVDGNPCPHLHAHCFAANLTWDESEKRFKAGQFGELKKDAPYFEAAFDARLAHRLEALGYATRKAKYSFELEGVSQSVIDKFSERRNQIEAEAKAKGVTSPEGKHAIGYRNRERKTHDVGKSELRREWNARLTHEERTALRRVMNGDVTGGGPVSPAKAMDYAVGHAFERSSVVAEKRLKAEALRFGVGSVLPADIAGIAKRRGMIAREKDGEMLTTTMETLKGEVAMLQFAREGHRRFAPILNAARIEDNDLGGLSQEQRAAAMHILTSRDTVTGVIGKAGTGKTRMMRATVEAIEGAGKRVFAFAPSAQASREVLVNEGFKDATTLAMLLKSEELQNQTKGGVVWVDEAGLVSAKDMQKLMNVIKQSGARLVLSGDYSQHGSVAAGDAFRLLEKEAGVRLASLREVRRQTEPGYKKAVQAIAKGSGKAAQQGFDALDRMGCVIEAEGKERHRHLIGDYVAAREEGKSALIIAPTHAEGAKLTSELRSLFKERGEIGKERTFKTRQSAGWTQAQKRDTRNYEPGMVIEFNDAVAGVRRREGGMRVTQGGFRKAEAVVVTGREDDGIAVMRRDGTRATLAVEFAERFEVYRPAEIAIGKADRIRVTRNGEARIDGQAKGTKVNNGDIFTVEGFTKEGDIRIGGGRLLPKGYGHFTLGYVDTSYASQGKTVDRVFIAAGNESLKAANQQQWYVSVTRGREMAKVYVDSKEDVRSAIARSAERLSAVELTRTRIRKTSGTRLLKTLLDHQRFRRFVRDKAAAIAEYWQRGKEGVSRA